MLDDVYADPTALRRLRTCVLADHLDDYCAWLHARGYPRSTVRAKIGILGRLARWMERSCRAVSELDDACARSFVDARRQAGLRPRHVEHTVRQFVEFLRSGDVLPPAACSDPDTPAAALLASYERYLREERALATSTIAAYRRAVATFLAAGVTDHERSTIAPTASSVRAFLLASTRGIPPRRAQFAATALRSFLRFCFLRGHSAVDLSHAVPTVRQGPRPSVRRHVSVQQVESVLRACDLSTPKGRRDHALLLLLARLGLRAGEVVALELDDLRWRQSEIVVRGKGLVRDRLPLLPDVGAAIARYLEHDRPSTTCRRLFLCRRPPVRGFSHPSSVTTIVTRAFARAGVGAAAGARGAHALRHGLAMAMLGKGASYGEIGEVLRHRSQQSTEIYARLDFEALRGVAPPWPVTGGVR